MIKHKLYLIFILTLLLSVCFAVSVYAWDCAATPDFSGGSLSLSGTATPGEKITVLVLSQGSTPDTLLNGIASDKKITGTAQGILPNGDTLSLPTVIADLMGSAVYVGDVTADSEVGDFALTVDITDSGFYDAYLFSSADGMRHSILDIHFINSGDYADLIGNLNQLIETKNRDGFVAMAVSNADMLGFKNALSGISVDVSDAMGILYDSLNGDNLSDDYAENVSLYERCAAITLLNSSKITNAAPYLSHTLAEDSKLNGWYSKYITSDTSEAALTGKLTGKSLADTDELHDAVAEALILYVVEHPNGYRNIQTLFNDYMNVLGLSSVSTNSTVYSQLDGQNFASISALVSRYNTLVSAGTGIGGGGNGGGSLRGGSSGGGPNIGTVENPVTQVEPISVDIFNDLDSVPWAKEAIVELTVRKVVSGRDANTFAPNDTITREEFTKLAAAAFAGNVEPEALTFADVESGRWSYEYIAKAVAAGLVHGNSETEFSPEALITRQDMAVIIYNTAKYKNVALADASDAMQFADDGEIADYAKEAVYALRAAGIINGMSDMEFAPLQNATRAEAAVLIYALLLR